jgi:NAD+ kinase
MKVLLFTNTGNAATSPVVTSVCTWLTGQGIGYELLSSDIFEEKPRFDERTFAIGRFDLVCSFGGDGTTLRAAHLVGSSGVPLLSYNFGRLGFLSGAGKADLIPALAAAVEGMAEDGLTYDPRMLLEVSVTYEDGQVGRQIALNEVVVSRGHFGRTVTLDLSINGTFIDTVKGDGVLVATPTGSTAYSLSAGGPIIAPAHEGLCVVPISPHSIKARAVITAKDDLIRLEPSRLNRQQLVLFIDGEVFWTPSPLAGTGDSLAEADGTATAEGGPCTGTGEVVAVEIGACAERLKLVRYGDYDFYDHISQTFFRGGNA